MKKIPTLFERDWDGDRSRVIDKVTPGCEWVLAGEGVPYQKLDGTCCMIRDHVLYKRREVKKGKAEPVDFELVEEDEKTGKRVGWVQVGNGLEDKWYREAFQRRDNWPNCTLELIGPKVQGNPERAPFHMFVGHSQESLQDSIRNAPRTFEDLRKFLQGTDIEGIVWHHPDGRMAKIKLRDFGLKRAQTNKAA